MLSYVYVMIYIAPVLLFAITIHEYAHGRTALYLGDPTAKNMGRLTLNPLPHIDPIGAICLLIFHFGWAKPVPVNSVYFKNIRRDTIIVSLAGPFANVMAAFFVGILIRHSSYLVTHYPILLSCFLIINLGLGLFNLLPFPPLDGSHILENALSPKAAQKYREIGRYLLFIFLGILFLDLYADVGIFSYVLEGPRDFLAHLFAGDNVYRLPHFRK